jgi:hypothetical protein
MKRRIEPRRLNGGKPGSERKEVIIDRRQFREE